MVIGKGGTEVETLRKHLNDTTGKRVHINIVEIKRADLDAKLVAESIARQLEGRVSFRRAQKQAIQRTMRSGAKGIKTQVSGRLGGADIARAEHYSEGTVPLHTLRADIDYAHAEADTTYGKIGVKVWIYRGEVLPVKKNSRKEANNMLMPKRVKYRREHRGKMRGEAKGGKEIAFGEFGLQATEASWITSRQIEAARIAMTRYMKRGGKVWIKIFPHKPYTKKPLEVRMGSGKGSPEGWVAVVKPGKVMFEIAGVSEEIAREALRLAAHKLPVKCKIVKRQEIGGESMKANDIRELTTAEIEQKVKSLKEELFNLRFQLATGQLENTARIREVRKAIARMKTVDSRREISANN